MQQICSNEARIIKPSNKNSFVFCVFGLFKVKLYMHLCIIKAEEENITVNHKQ
jgi:hypothetical protein